MTTPLTYCSAIVLFLVLAACQQDGATADAEVMAVVNAPSHEQLAVTEIRFSADRQNFMGNVPDELNYVTVVESSVNPHTGDVSVSVGKEFVFTVARDDAAVSELREDVASSDLFEIVFFGEGDETFFYEAVLPDGRSAGHHFVRSFEFNGSRYVIRTDEQRQYGYFATQLAARTINSLRIVD